MGAWCARQYGPFWGPRRPFLLCKSRTCLVPEKGLNVNGPWPGRGTDSAALK